MASCGRHEQGPSGSEDEDADADRHDPAVQAVFEERRRQRRALEAAGAGAGADAAAPAPAAAIVVVPAPLPTSTMEQRAEAQRMRAGAAARTRPSGWYHAQEQRRVVVAAAAEGGDGADGDGGGGGGDGDRRRRQHLWAGQNAAAISGPGGAGRGSSDARAALREAQDEHVDDEAGRVGASATTETEPATTTATATAMPTCRKCRAAPAVALLRQNEPLCGGCASEGALGKARAALRVGGGGRVRAGDRVAVALSGGCGSLGMLRALLRLRAPGGASAERPERGRHAFDAMCLHVRESALAWIPLPPATAVALRGAGQPLSPPSAREEEAWAAAATGKARAAAERRADALESELRGAARALGCEGGLTVVRLEDVFCDADEEVDEDGGGGTTDGRSAEDSAAAAVDKDGNGGSHDRRLRRLSALLSCVRDATAREDLAESLRDRLLRRTASGALSCDALALGDSAGTVALRVIAGAAKGRAFSMPADVAAAGVAPPPPPPSSSSRARGAAGSGRSPCALAVLRPVRDVTAAELAVSFCHESGRARAPEEEADAAEAGAAAAAGRWSGGGGAAGGSGRRPAASINALTRGFVSAIEAHLPASIYAVLRSAGSLQAFAFNEDAALLARPGGQRQRRRRRQAVEEGPGGGGGGAGEEAAPAPSTPGQPEEQRCRVCSSPLLPAERAREIGGAGAGTGAGAAAAAATKKNEASRWPAGSLGALDGGGAQGVCYCCERQVLDLMLPSSSGDERGDTAGEGDDDDDEASASAAAGGSPLPGEAERKARRARRRRRLARLRALLPP